MLDVIVKDVNFRKMLEAHCKETIEYLLKKEQNFSVLCYLKYTKFDPQLPEHIIKNFGEITLFSLSNYTLQSAKIDDNSIVFEAGFGEENIGSVVTLPLFSIIQVIVSENAVFLNPSSNIPIINVANSDEKAEQNSMRAILSNPKNAELLKRS